MRELTDTELLELAAKAAGIEQITWNDHPDLGRLGGWLSDGTNSWWNPLTSDGDALRLAVRLQLLDLRNVWNAVHDTTNPRAATRRAIVRSAAEIGKAMP